MQIRILDDPLIGATLVVSDLSRTYYEFSSTIVSKNISHPSWFSKNFQKSFARSNDRVSRPSLYPVRGFNGTVINDPRTQIPLWLMMVCFNPMGLTPELLDRLVGMIKYGIPKQTLGVIEPDFRCWFNRVFGFPNSDEDLEEVVAWNLSFSPSDYDEPVIFLDLPLTVGLARYLIKAFGNNSESEGYTIDSLVVFQFQKLFTDPMVMNSPEFKDFLDI